MAIVRRYPISGATTANGEEPRLEAGDSASTTKPTWVLSVQIKCHCSVNTQQPADLAVATPAPRTLGLLATALYQ